MSEKLEEQQSVNVNELLMSTIYTQEAMLNLLQKKGLLTWDDLIGEINDLQKENGRS